MLKKKNKEIKKALRLKMVVFYMEKDGKEKMVNGINLYKELKTGWSIQGFRIKDKSQKRNI